MQKDLETKIEICGWKICAEEKKNNGLNELRHISDYRCYGMQGCFNCDGYNTNCKKYFALHEFEK